MGCPGEWQPDCADAAFEAGADGVWRGSFTLPAGDYEYKAAINGGWDENYGANATSGGDNISLSVSEEQAVRFYYSHESHWGAGLYGCLGSGHQQHRYLSIHHH